MRIRGIIKFLCLLVLVALHAQAQAPQPTSPGNAPPLPEVPPPIATQLKKTAAFITVTFRNGPSIAQARGTAFFLFVPDERLGKNRAFSYLVTNRHVAAPEVGGAPAQVLSVTLRVNRKVPLNGITAEEAAIPLNTSRWYFPSDSSVDLAVMPLGFDEQKYDILAIPIDLLVTAEMIQKERIAEGDTVVFTGFFYQFVGQKRVQPIVRQGTIAMLPDEEIALGPGRSARLYLADVHVFGGNSGSPVFINLGGFRGGSIIAGAAYKLLGIVSGYFYETADFQLQIATTLNGKANANSGITTVIPAEELKSLLETAALKQQREDTVATEARHKQ
jgi:hypothetical protein